MIASQWHWGLGFDIPKLEGVIDKPFSLDIATKYTHLFEQNLTQVQSDGNTRAIDIGGSILTFFMGVDFEF